MGVEETAVSDKIRDFLKKKGFIMYRMQSGRSRVKGQWVTLNPTGTPDLIGITPRGRFIAIETKSSHGKASEAQKTILEAYRKRGGIAMVAPSFDSFMQQLTIEMPGTIL